MAVNICMIARDRPEQTKACLDSLLANTDRDVYNLTIVDDTSKPETTQLLYGYGARHGFHICRNEEPLGVGGSKNRCVEESEQFWGRDKFLYLSDNDVLFTKDWLAKLTSTYTTTALLIQAKILGGYSHPFNGTNKVCSWFPDVEEAFLIHTKNAVDGLSWLLEWSTWDQFGKLMDNARGVRQSEDFEYCQRIRKAGFEVGVVYPHVIINNGMVDTFGNDIPGRKQAEEAQAKNVELDRQEAGK